MARVFDRKIKLKINPFNNIKHLCPYCNLHVEDKDFVSSFRLQPDGYYLVVGLCRKCRNDGI